MLPLTRASTLGLPGWDPSTAHLPLVALQEGDEQARDGTGCGVHLGERRARIRDDLSCPGEAEGVWASGSGGSREAGRGGAGAYCVGKLQLPGLLLEHDVQPAALEVRAVGSTGDLGAGRGGLRGSPVGGPVPVPHCVPTAAGAHLAKAAAARHPGLDIELAVGGEAQFLGGHVQDAAAEEKVVAKVSERQEEVAAVVEEEGEEGEGTGGDGREDSQKRGKWKRKRRRSWWRRGHRGEARGRGEGGRRADGGGEDGEESGHVATLGTLGL